MSVFECIAPKTVAEIVASLPLHAKVMGASNRVIKRYAALDDVASGALCFSKSEIAEIPEAWSQVEDLVVIVPSDKRVHGSDKSQITFIATMDPRAYFVRAVNVLMGAEKSSPPSPSLSTAVEAGASVGENVYIGPNASIGSGAVIGNDCIIYGGVRIYGEVIIGAGCVVQANAIIGSEGQSFVRDENGAMVTLPHRGRVRLGARCHVGGGAVIVRGTLRDTVIGADTSIGNLSNIGHNVLVGERCFIGAGSILSGSSVVGDDSWVSLGAIIRSVAVGNNVTVGPGAVVTRAVADGQTVNGFPARVAASGK